MAPSQQVNAKYNFVVYVRPLVLKITANAKLNIMNIVCRLHNRTLYYLIWDTYLVTAINIISSRFQNLKSFANLGELINSIIVPIHKKGDRMDCNNYRGIFPVGFPVEILKALLPSSILTTCPAHLNLLDLITLTILGERYKLWSPSLWSLLHSPFSYSAIYLFYS